jgi:sterol desaturase/sphingolipid hydroxylase (fatty acid hydroxylase superfamily)
MRLVDLTVSAVPGYFATMAAEAAYLKRRAARNGRQARSDYERRDTIASLAMGVGSLLAPIVMPKVLGPITPGKGKYGKAFVAGLAVAAAATATADVIARRSTRDAANPDLAAPARDERRRVARRARSVAGVGAAVAVGGGVAAISTAWTAALKADRLWGRRIVDDLGEGPLAWLAAIVGWDFIYYWNHRFMHESRYMWAIHVVHHSSERYNLSTALRQPVADAFGTFVPYGLLALFGVRPRLIVQARAINLIYQYWIHTDVIRGLGPAEAVLNTPSHHRVHHGANRQYLDRNHGSILIIWDRLFGTFEREDEPVVYGLTKNIDSFSPAVIATHEHRDILRDVAAADTWHDRLSFAFRGPGWAYGQHAERAAATLGVTVSPAA